VKKIFFIISIVSVSWISSYAQSDSTDYWISIMSNKQLIINYNHYIGRSLGALSSGAFKLMDIGKPATEKLLHQLTTEDKGIISHYILSKIYSRGDSHNLEYPDKNRYNGLVFRPLRIGFISDSTDLIKCKEDWMEFLKKN